MVNRLVRFVKSRWFIGAACLVLGALIILGIRFITYKPDDVHYHANFALYINGQRELFQGPRYYEETEMCAVNTGVTVGQRAHMHDNVNDVVHIEDHAVTWGQFFSNLGWTLGPNFLQAPDETMYAQNGQQKLNIILNGMDYTDISSIQNEVVKDRDRLLVSFGQESTSELAKQYASVASSAHQYDITPDPKSCSGHSENMLLERMQHLL